jgi:TIR domain
MPRVDEIRVFCSYSHQDRSLRDELVKHLELLRESLLIRAWHDGELTGGQDWQQEIEGHLRDAHVILLLISIDFLRSKFVQEHELPVALARHKAGDALVIPVILRPVPWGQAGLEFLQALPDGLRPVVLWSPQDLAYVNICEGLFAAVLVWQGRKSPAAASPMDRPTAVRRRVVDLALSRRVPVRKATILAVMVRRVGEGGLRAVLQADDSLGVKPEEVESSDSFPLEFPRKEDGRLAPLDLTIAIDSRDFSCRAPQKVLPVPPGGDSAVCVFLLEANRLGPLVLVVDISYSGKVLLSRVLKSEGVSEAAFQPAVEELPGLEFGEELAEPPTVSVFPGSPISEATIAYLPPPPPPAAPSARPQPEAIAMRSAPKRFPLRTAGMAVASVLVLASVFGTWYARRPTLSAVSSARQPEPVEQSGPVAAPNAEPASPSVAAAPPSVEPTPSEPTPPPSPSNPTPPENYELCAFGSGTTVFGMPRTLTLAQIMNGLQASCGFSGTGETYDVTIRWLFSGETRAESTKTTTVAVGDAVSVATSGAEWAYGGPMEPGQVQVTVASVRRSDGRMNTWTGAVRLTR